MKKHIFLIPCYLIIISLLLVSACKPKTCPQDPSKCPVNDPELITANINSDRTLTNTLTGADYIIEGDIELSSHLTIEKGTEIQFKDCASLIIRQNGKLTAVGTMNLPILFTGLEKTKGYWKGLFFNGSDATENKFTYCIVEYGGCSNSDMIAVGNTATGAARLSMDHSTVRNALGNGLYIANNSFLDEATNCTFSGNGYPIKTHFENPNVALDNTSIYTDNVNPYIYLKGFALTASNTTNTVILPNPGIPYFLEGNMSIGGDYTIAQGAAFAVAQNGGIRVGLNGNFTATNTTFQGRVATPAYWTGIYMTDGIATLNNCTLSDGGAAHAPSNDTLHQAMIYLSSSWANPDLRISNSTISNVPKHALTVQDLSGSHNPVISVNTNNILTPNTAAGGESVHHF